jgi:hypothetical protein
MANPKDNKSAAEPESYLEPPAAKPVEKEKSLFAGLRVSLMPTELAGSAAMDPRRALAILVIVLIAETALIGVAYLGVIKVTNDRTAAMEAYKSELTSLRARTKTMEGQAGLAAQFSAQYAANQISLDQHLYWTQFFAKLEKYILPNVQCVSFSGDVLTGAVNLSCHGRNYRDVAEQVVYMRTNPDLVELRTNSASAEMDKDGKPISTSFDMNMKFKPSVWHAEEPGQLPVLKVDVTSSPTAPTVPTITDVPVELEQLKPATTAPTP